MTQAPPPMTPADCDLQAMTFMPVDIIRLFGSEFHALSTDAEWRAGLTLWLKSWHQVPAASLPNDDVQLARHAELGRDLKGWRKVRDGALRGWIFCADGRLYHPVVAEKALDAWARRGEWQERQENRQSRQQRWRERCKALADQLRGSGVTPPAGAPLATLEEMVERLHDVDLSVDTQTSTDASPVDAPEMPLTGTRTGTGTGTIDSTVVADPAANDWPITDPVRTLVGLILSPRLDPSKSPGLTTTAGRLAAWKRGGASWEFDVVPVVTACCQRPGGPISSWKFFDAAIAQSVADNAAGLALPPAHEQSSGGSSRDRTRRDARPTPRQANFGRSLTGALAATEGK